MYFKQLLDERYGCASYVVASRQSREAVIVDPSLEGGPYEALLRERDFQLRVRGVDFRNRQALQFQGSRHRLSGLAVCAVVGHGQRHSDAGRRNENVFADPAFDQF